MRKAVALMCAVCSVVMLSSTEAAAGPYADELAKCLVRSTTASEKNALMKWIFAAAALHPEVKGISSVTDAQRDELSKSTGRIVERLLADSCKTETQDALRYEGPAVFQSSFTVLGQVAAVGLFTDLSVSGYMSDFLKYIDKAKMQDALLSSR
jgi:maltose-binding protein MalE